MHKNKCLEFVYTCIQNCVSSPTTFLLSYKGLKIYFESKDKMLKYTPIMIETLDKFTPVVIKNLITLTSKGIFYQYIKIYYSIFSLLELKKINMPNFSKQVNISIRTLEEIKYLKNIANLSTILQLFNALEIEFKLSY